MAQDISPKPSSPSNQFKQTSKSGVSLRQIIEILSELNIARKSILLYPLGHHQVKQACQRTCQQLDSLLSICSEITIGVTAKGLIWKGETLDPQNATVKEFAKCLTDQGIVVFTLIKGLGEEELINFFYALSQNSQQLQAQGGLLNTLHQQKFKHIRITLIDYNQFKVTEEYEIIRQRKDEESEQPNDIWHQFAVQLMDNSLVQKSFDIDPQQVAHLLNQQPDKAKAVLEQYENTLQNSLQADKDGHGLSRKWSVEISGIMRLLQDLNPKLRHQFLISTLNQCAQSHISQKSQALLDQLPHNMVVEMLEKVNQSGNSIPESSMRLIQKLSHSIANNKDSIPSSKAPQKLKELTPDKFQEIFKQDEYQKHITEDYYHLLQNLDKPQGSSPSKEMPFQKEDPFESSSLNQHIFGALIGLMESCNSPESYEAYREYANKVVKIAKESFYQQDFETPFKAIEMFRQHLTEPKPENIIEVAQTALARLTDPKLVDDFIKTVDRFDSTLPSSVSSLLKTIGPSIVQPLVQSFIKGGPGEKQHTILKLLGLYKKESITAVQKLVRRDDIEGIKKMIFLIRQLNERAASAHLRSLVANINPEISREALEALLYFNDPYSIIFLRDRLNSENADDIVQAITMAGDYRIQTMVPDLIALVKYSALSKTDIKRNTDVVSALGKIGDSAAIECLAKLAQNGWSLYRSNLRQLKIHIFQSLKGYPRDSIKTMLALGRQSKDRAIEQICNQLSPSDQ